MLLITLILTLLRGRKDLRFSVQPYGIPELIAAASVVIVQVRKRSSLISILTGTAVYMLLLQLVF